MSTLSGRIGGLTFGYDLHATWDGTRLHGRTGGRFQGLDLTGRGGSVDGRVGGTFAGFGVDGEVTPERVQVRLGGRVDGDDVALSVRGEHISGRCSGRRLGQDVDLRLGGVPAPLIALAAVSAYKALEDVQAASVSVTTSG